MIKLNKQEIARIIALIKEIVIVVPKMKLALQEKP